MKTYKYDVAISFAEEDVEVAKLIEASCNKLNMDVFFYKSEIAENWGENIFNIIIQRYKEQSRFALILISENYVKKEWAKTELRIIQTVLSREGSAYLLPLRLDDTPVPGLTDDIQFETWKNNPDGIAELLKEKLSKQNPIPLTTKKPKKVNIKQKLKIKGSAGKVTTIGEAGDVNIN